MWSIFDGSSKALINIYNTLKLNLDILATIFM